MIWRSVIRTDWGDFDAPADVPEMVEVRQRNVFTDEPRWGKSFEPVKSERDSFYRYVNAQGERLRDSLEPESYTEWKARAQ